jgi:dephospho-CoA kinase
MNTPVAEAMARPIRRRPRHAPRRHRLHHPRRVAGPWKHGSIPVIGLVGGIGAGKSRVAATLARQGAWVLDADAIGHALLDQPPARSEVVRRFGAEILAPASGPDQPRTVDRKALGTIVFGDPSARRDLEAILHPRMRRTFERAIARVARGGRHSAVVLDAAVLFEAHWDSLCDRVVFVDAPREQRLARLAASRDWSAEELAARESAQLPLAEKRARADLVLTNDASPESLDERTALLWREHFEPNTRFRGPRP